MDVGDYIQRKDILEANSGEFNPDKPHFIIVMIDEFNSMIVDKMILDVKSKEYKESLITSRIITNKYFKLYQKVF